VGSNSGKKGGKGGLVTRPKPRQWERAGLDIKEELFSISDLPVGSIPIGRRRGRFLKGRIDDGKKPPTRATKWGSLAMKIKVSAVNPRDPREKRRRDGDGAEKRSGPQRLEGGKIRMEG